MPADVLAHAQRARRRGRTAPPRGARRSARTSAAPRAAAAAARASSAHADAQVGLDRRRVHARPPRARPCRRRRTRTRCRSSASAAPGRTRARAARPCSRRGRPGSAAPSGSSPSPTANPSASSSSWPGRAHRHRDRLAVDADLERLLDRDQVVLARARGQPRDANLGGRAGQSPSGRARPATLAPSSRRVTTTLSKCTVPNAGTPAARRAGRRANSRDASPGWPPVRARTASRGCSIDRVEWESSGFPVEEVAHVARGGARRRPSPSSSASSARCRAPTGSAAPTRPRASTTATPRRTQPASGSTRSTASRARGGRRRRQASAAEARETTPSTEHRGAAASTDGGARRAGCMVRRMAVRDRLTVRISPATRRRPPEDPMLAQTPGVEAQGRGPADGKQPSRRDYHHPAAGWGAARSVGKVLWRAREPVEGPRAVLRMNHEDKGFDCPGCAWPDDQQGPAPRHLRERHQARHLGDDAQAGRRRVLRRAHRHRARALERLRARGPGPARRAADLRPRAATRTCRSPGTTRSRSSATTLRGLASPNEASFYTSGRLGNEATFLYQLWVRELGTNNLPDCSNMCHEASGRALTASLGTGKGTVRPRATGSRPTLIFVIGVERRLERAADADRAGRRVRARRAGRARQPARRGGVRAHDRPARLPATMATFRTHADRHARTSSRASAATSRSCAASPRRCSRRPSDPTRSTARSSTSTRPASRTYRALCADDARGTSSSASRASTRRRCATSRASTPSAERTIISLVPRPHPAGARRRHDPRDRQPAAAARQHRPPGRRAVADPRALNVQGNRTCGVNHRPQRGVPRPARRRSAASTRRASTASTRCGTIEAHAPRRGEGLRRHGRQLRPRRARHRAARSRRCATAS